MATRKDQLQSHQFLGQRMVSALVTRETDPEQPPFKRATSAAFGGVTVMRSMISTPLEGPSTPGQ